MKKLIDSNGKVCLGWIKEPVEEVNYLDFDLQTVMDRPLSEWRKRLRFNQFHFIGLMSPEVICGIAVVDLKMLSNTFFYLYDFENKVMLEKSLLQPLGFGTHMGLSPDNSESVFSQGKYQVQIKSQGGHSTRVQVDAGNDISIDATLSSSAEFDPLRICSRAGYDGWVYTQKSAGLTVAGAINWQGRHYDLSPDTASGSVDWSCGYMRRDTFWNWACFSGFDSDGRRVGMNLAAGVNETGVTENCLWLGDKRQKLDMAVFVYDRKNIESEWQVTTTCGRVNLCFVPEGTRREKINAVVLASNFKQLFGKFYGEVRCGREKVKVDGLPGFVEDHYARW